MVQDEIDRLAAHLRMNLNAPAREAIRAALRLESLNRRRRQLAQVPVDCLIGMYPHQQAEDCRQCLT